MNRRGHLGTLLLVFGALILVSVSLFVMYDFGSEVDKHKSELRAVTSKSDALHKFLLKDFENMVFESITLSKGKNELEFEKNFNESFKSIAFREREKKVRNINTNLYAQISLGNYSLKFVELSGKYELVVGDVFEKTDFENHEIKYLYSVKVIFDKEKIYSVYI